MPAIADHPVRLARLRAGLSIVQLAGMAGVHRSTLHALEEGRTRMPTPQILSRLDLIFSQPDGTLSAQLDRFAEHRNDDPSSKLLLKARAVLSLPPSQIDSYRSFVHWRRDISPTPTSFASLLGLPRSTVANYEKGVRQNGMPFTLGSAIVRVLGVNNDYLLALARLEPDDE